MTQVRMAAKVTSWVPFPIRRNLYQALVKLRSRENEVNIWVDAICIDQSERGKGEKEEQLAQMAEIYNSASNVCIWLGDTYEGSKDGIRLVNEIMNLKTFDALVNTPDAKDRWSHLIQIMKAPWFSRRWIIQEVALARNASIHCADEVLHWDDFADAVSLLTEKIEILRDKFRDEIFEDVEATSACVLVHTLTNVCRKSDTGRILGKISDLETLVSTLLGFQASFPRDTIYSILSLARDIPRAGEPWEKLHEDQLVKNRRNAELLNGKQSGSSAHRAGPRRIGLTANYKSSTRDLFIAFVTRCIQRSESLDIICRHWAPPITDKVYGQVVQMPSWISAMSGAEYGLLGTSKGRQNGENFVAYSPHDRRQRYQASGSFKAEIRMVNDPSLDPPEIPRPIHITDGPFSQSPLPSPTVESPARELHTIPEEPENMSELPSVDNPPNLTYTVGGPMAEASDSTDQLGSIPNGAPTVTPLIQVTPGTPRSQSITSNNDPGPDAPASEGARPVIKHLPKPARRSTKVPDVEQEHELSGILAVRGFVVGTITERSEIMRGGIIPGDWISRMGWNKEQYDNRVPDMLWRLLVADRTHRGGKPPQWYKRSCLHGLVDPRVADAEGNLHSVTEVDRHISEMTTKYFKRVERVVWNRRLLQADIHPDFDKLLLGLDGPLLGLTPKETKVDDIICILLGCTVPVILRAVKGGRVAELYQLIGEAYVHGIMDGEAVESEKSVEGETLTWRRRKAKTNGSPPS
ncbi:hypothetical protein BDZ45DRAFT_250827 [Acephala macrosclerotiorum]|nr:hypothetical protein BDZ45DRAFT_250827 [Acephala macrosclerotiorum]